MGERVRVIIDRKTILWADRPARRQGISRDEFLRTAICTATERHGGHLSDVARQRRQRRAIDGMNRLARKFGEWPADEILRAFRYPWLKSSQEMWSRSRRKT
jgi:hypothetical protein